MSGSMADHLIRGFKQLATSELFAAGSVVTTGAFDGLHLGHQRLLAEVVATARAKKLPSVALTFEPLPREYFSRAHSPASMPARLMSFREKFEGLRELGIDYVLLARFDDNMRSMSAEDFVRELFIDGLNAKHVIVGDDFRFGANAAGDFQLLQNMLGEVGASVASIDSQIVTDLRVSSSAIRERLEQGQLQEAEALLGRPYSIRGKVFPGQQLGRQLGFPTANIQLRRRCTAMAGVYCVEVSLANKCRMSGDVRSGGPESENDCLPAVANVGTRPTIMHSKHVTLEVHLLDYEGDLYGKRLSVCFRKKLRDEQKFDGVDALQAQIKMDTQNARSFFEGI